ncbi:MAG: hypothetical protein Q7S26_03335 [bacterium]|nr:hypothetical protein [bacterium]
MADHISITERAGLPFEQRCEAAKESLQGLWSVIEKFAEDDLLDMQETAEGDKSFLSALRSEAREIISPMAVDLSQSVAKANARLRGALWSQGLQFVRDAFGTDATEFALTAIKRQHSGH